MTRWVQPASQCAPPSTGACNGHCMCPRYEPPRDAGPAPLDAPTVP